MNEDETNVEDLTERVKAQQPSGEDNLAAQAEPGAPSVVTALQAALPQPGPLTGYVVVAEQQLEDGLLLTTVRSDNLTEWHARGMLAQADDQLRRGA